MVKNAGGNKAKRQAKKFTNTPPKRNLRVIQEEGELYAAVTKIYGGANCEVICMDQVARLCVIRNKFRGRHKRDNQIVVGAWVLVGLREWEVRTVDKLPRCDLLEVYTSIEKEKLQLTVKDNVAALMMDDQDKDASDMVNFIDDELVVDTAPLIHEEGAGEEEYSDEIDIDEI